MLSAEEEELDEEEWDEEQWCFLHHLELLSSLPHPCLELLLA
jgi:hypothetical protein